jgi:hypothetical protein
MTLNQLQTLEFCYEEKRLVDTQKAAEWIEYHRSVAKLRKICATCNMSNHAYGYSNRATPPKTKLVKKVASKVRDKDEVKFVKPVKTSIKRLLYGNKSKVIEF